MRFRQRFPRPEMAELLRISSYKKLYGFFLQWRPLRGKMKSFVKVHFLFFSALAPNN